MSLEQKLQKENPSFLQKIRSAFRNYGLTTFLLTTSPLLFSTCGEESPKNPPVTGCLSDSECKGGRLCVDGECVFPEEVDGGYTCQDECSSNGTKQCFDNGYKTCGNYDADECLEWSGLTACQADEYCSSGQCLKEEPVCEPHTNKICFGGDVYWEDSCGNRKEIIEYCGEGLSCLSGACVDNLQSGCDISNSQDVCVGNTVKECNLQANSMFVIDCEKYGTTCGYVDESFGYDCINCGILTSTPICDGDVKMYCNETNHVQQWIDCKSLGEEYTCQNGECKPEVLEGKIAFTSNNDIYVMNSDGGMQRRLTDTLGGNYSPSWSPDGSKIAFCSNWDFGSWRIWVMNADGNNQIGLIDYSVEPEEGTIECSPSWSPDGNKIAFFGSGNNIHLVNIDGSGERNLTNMLREEASWQGFERPALSPDFNKIAYIKRILSSPDCVESSRYDIYTVNINTGEQINQTAYLINFDGCFDSPYSLTLSPDGRKIAFGQRGDLFAIDFDRTEMRYLTSGYPLKWSPDGSKIAFGNNSANPSESQICIINQDGNGERCLTEGSSSKPVWSPDGQGIAFERNGDIYKIDVNNNAEINLTNSSASDSDPDWSQ